MSNPDGVGTARRIGRRAKDAAARGVSRVRDRRRRIRKRLEDIFNRKTFTSVIVAGAGGKLVETTVVPFIDPTAGVPLGRVLAWTVVFALAVVMSVHWERLARAAGGVADAAEDLTDGG
jgi:hypothetical protein